MAKIIALCLISLAACAAAKNIDDQAGSRIVGGVNAAQGEHPYQVSLRQNGGHFCGGSIINNNWILSAAHCLVGMDPVVVVTIVAGSNTLNAGGEEYPIINIVTHDQFDPRTFHNDIALLRTGRYIRFNDLVKVIPLASRDTPAGVYGRLSGWGYLSANGATPNVLQKLDVPTIDLDQCKKALTGYNQIFPEQVCTLREVGKGACQGDSGGPLVINGELAGLVSSGIPCARGIPDIFTRVYSYRDWIRYYSGV